MKHIESAHCTPTVWQYGQTTELMIYPPQANYQQQNFLWRVSIATVEAPMTRFSPLPGFMRLTCVLEGTLTLDHATHYRKQLQPLHYDVYEGAWHTISEGMVTNFNMIAKPDVAMELTQHLTELAVVEERFDTPAQYVIYALCAFRLQHGALVQAGDMLYIDARTKHETLIFYRETAPIAFLKVQLQLKKE